MPLLDLSEFWLDPDLSFSHGLLIGFSFLISQHPIQKHLEHSKFDQDRKRIVELLSLGVSIRKIALEHLKYGDPSSLYYFVQTRELIPEAEQLKANRD